MNTPASGVSCRSRLAWRSRWSCFLRCGLHITGICALLGMLMSARVASAQQVWLRPYEDEEDLWESYREGEITFEQYLELLDLFQAGADSIFQPVSDLEELPGYLPSDSASQLLNPPIEVDTRRPGNRRIELRGGYSLPLRERSGNDGYIVGRWQSDRIRAFVDGRSESSRPEGFRKRGAAFHFAGRAIQLTAGNFEPRYGLGLVVGRRDRVLGRTEETCLSGSIWQPKRANFNGLHLQSAVIHNLHVAAFASRIENTQYREDIAASQLTLAPVGGAIEVGVTCVASRIMHRQLADRFQRNGAGLSLSSRKPGRSSAVEIAFSDGGAAAAAARVEQPLSSGRISVALWTYDPGYILLSSGGPGHPGRQRVQLLPDGLDYYSRTAGEQGLLVDVRTDLKKQAGVESVFEVYRDRLADTRNFEGILALRMNRGRRMALRLYLRGRAEHGRDAEKDREYLGLTGRSVILDRHPVAWRVEYGATRENQEERQRTIRLELRGTISLNSIVRLTPRVRYVDPDLTKSSDGYWYAYLTETISAWRGVDFEIVVAARAFEDSTRHSYADVRIRIVWRP